MKVGYKKTNKDYTTQCKHCGSTAEFLEQIGETLYFVCTECRGFTPIKNNHIGHVAQGG